MKRSLFLLPIFIILVSLAACGPSSSLKISLQKQLITLDQSRGAGKINSDTLVVNVERTGTNSSVNLTAEDLPEGITVSPVIVSVGRSNGTLNFQASPAAQAGDYTVTVKGESDAGSSFQSLGLKVFGGAEFILTPELSSLSLEQQISQALTVTIQRDISFNSELTLSLEGKTFVQADPVTVAANETTAQLILQPIQKTTSPQTIALVGETASGRYITELTVSVIEAATQADFDMSISTEQLELPWNSSRELKVSILRNSRFSGAIVVSATNLPFGVSAESVTIAESQDSAVLTLAAADDLGDLDTNVTITARGVGDLASVIKTKNLGVQIVEQPALKAEVIATNLAVPWDIEFATDGRLFITERAGTTKVLENGVITELPNPLDVYAPGGEPGLMGLSLDPNFDTNNFLYVCYSYQTNGTKNRISRLTLVGSELRDEVALISDLPGAGIHNGCRLAFGPDGKLYATTGDANNPEDSQSTSVLSGKVLRINSDGSVPSDNPFGNEVWAYGLRNSQGLVFHPNGQLYGTEHGGADDDEINLLERGNNYGWPNVTGTTSTNEYTGSLVEYTPTLAVAGMTVYTGDVFPEFKDDLLFVSLKAGQLRQLELNADGTVANDTVILDYDYGRLRDIAVSPDGRIFLATSNQDGRANTSLDFPTAQDDRIIVLSK